MMYHSYNLPGVPGVESGVILYRTGNCCYYVIDYDAPYCSYNLPGVPWVESGVILYRTGNCCYYVIVYDAPYSYNLPGVP